VGAAYAYWLTFIEPISMYDPVMSITVIIMVMLGGAGTVAGPVLGAMSISLLSEYLWSKFLGVHLGTLGLSLILVVLFLPKGFMDIIAASGSGQPVKRIISELRSNASRYRA
jgi:branched-chain amino acid transport system permease protein